MSMIQKIKTVYHNTISEGKKCTWPGKDELFQSTLVVIFALILLVVFVAGVDAVASKLVQWLTN